MHFHPALSAEFTAALLLLIHGRKWNGITGREDGDERQEEGGKKNEKSAPATYTCYFAMTIVIVSHDAKLL